MRLIGSALALAAFLLLLFYMGGPIAPRTIEVDVTDKISENMPARGGR